MHLREILKVGDKIKLLNSDGSISVENPLIVSKIHKDKVTWVVARKEGTKYMVHLQDGEFTLMEN